MKNLETSMTGAEFHESIQYTSLPEEQCLDVFLCLNHVTEMCFEFLGIESCGLTLDSYF